MRYRPEIDGLRAVAVLAVIAFHAGLPAIGGGYFGVDVFFVISGFVIGSVLITEVETGQFSVIGFFIRRIRRLGPALLVVVAATLLGGWFYMLPWDFDKLGRSSLAVFGLFANFHFMKAADYFSPDSENMPLLHAWSLSIEEQLYLVLPTALLIALRFKVSKQWIIFGLVIVTAASFLLAGFYPYKLAATRFYGTGTRAWELFAGVLLAYSLPYLPALNGRIANAVSVLGVATIGVSFFAFDQNAIVPGLPSLLPVIGTLLVLATIKPDHFIYKMLASPIVVSVGVVSYSAYLWHQPIFAFGRIQAGPMGLGAASLAALLLLVAIVSFLSYRFVETPFRSRSLTTNRQVLATVFAGLLALVGASVVITQSHGLKDAFVARLEPDQALRVKALGDAIASRGLAGMTDNGNCQFWQDQLSFKVKERIAQCAKQHGRAIVALGDSHAMDLFNALKAASGKPFIIGLSRGACGPKRTDDLTCPFQAFKIFAEQNPSVIERVFMTQSGNFFATGEKIDEAAIGSLKAYLEALSTHVPVLWVGPQYEPGVILERLNPYLPFDRAFTVAVTDKVFGLDAELLRRAKGFRMDYFSKLKATFRDARNDFIIDGEFTYSDQDHWSTVGERVFGQRLAGALRGQGFL